MQDNHIFKLFSDEIAYLICPEHQNFHQQDDSQVINVYQSLKENLSTIAFWGSKETLVTAAIVIAKLFGFKHFRELMKENFSQLGEDKYASLNQQKRKMGKIKYDSLQNTFNILSSCGTFPNYNCMSRMDTIKVVLLMQHIQENFQLKNGHLSNVIIDGQKFKHIPVYERSGKGIKFLFK